MIVGVEKDERRQRHLKIWTGAFLSFLTDFSKQIRNAVGSLLTCPHIAHKQFFIGKASSWQKFIYWRWIMQNMFFFIGREKQWEGVRDYKRHSKKSLYLVKRSEMHNRDLRDFTLLQVAATKTKIHHTYVHHLFIHVMPRSTKDSLKRARAACC